MKRFPPTPLTISGGLVLGAVSLGTTAGLSYLMGPKLGLFTEGLIIAAAGIALLAWQRTNTLEQLAGVLESICERPGETTVTPEAFAAFEEVFEAIRVRLAREGRACEELDEVYRAIRVLQTQCVGQNGNGDSLRETGGASQIILELGRGASEDIAHRIETLGGLAERIVARTLDQSKTLSRTTSTVEVLSEKIDRISQSAEGAATACEKARQEARQGIEQLQAVSRGIEHLRQRVEQNGCMVRRLGDRSVEIGSIVELIQGLSQRTDMLALNATIESVRAGEHGRGFAVVAEEIRKLAERAADATREIDSLIEAIQADARESVRSVAEEQAEMIREADRIKEANEALERIRHVSEQSSQLVAGITRSATDQVIATQMLVQAMQRISEVSQETHEGASSVYDEVDNLTRQLGNHRPRNRSPRKGTDGPTPGQTDREPRAFARAATA